MGFINFKDFSDVGLDDRHLMIDGCSYFLYLTCKQKSELDRGEDSRENVWLNLLIVDAYNKVP